MAEIKTYLEGWGPDLDEYYLYELWKEDRILPYAGGWLDQPVWIHTLFNNCALWDEWLTLNSKLPSTKGLKSFNDIAGD